ncbi:MAG: hypothetical protein AB1489_11220 [Acidobacteriota bacterium]
MLATVKNENLRVYVVWLPIIRTDKEARVPAATTRIPDLRATHYWDGQSTLSRSFSEVLGLKGLPAWDVYLLYGPTIHWQDQPPIPEYWMHQLNQISHHDFLDGDKLAKEVEKLLSTKSP